MDNSLSDNFCSTDGNDAGADCCCIFLSSFINLQKGRPSKEIARYFNKTLQQWWFFLLPVKVHLSNYFICTEPWPLRNLFFIRKKAIPVSKCSDNAFTYDYVQSTAGFFSNMVWLFNFPFYESALNDSIHLAVLFTLVSNGQHYYLLVALKLQVLLLICAIVGLNDQETKRLVDNLITKSIPSGSVSKQLHKHRSALLRIFSWMYLKLLFWYIITFTLF